MVRVSVVRGSELRRNSSRGMTLVELIVAFTILLVLTSMAVPVARTNVRRMKERQLHQRHPAARFPPKLTPTNDTPRITYFTLTTSGGGAFCGDRLTCGCRQRLMQARPLYCRGQPRKTTVNPPAPEMPPAVGPRLLFLSSLPAVVPEYSRGFASCSSPRCDKSPATILLILNSRIEPQLRRRRDHVSNPVSCNGNRYRRIQLRVRGKGNKVMWAGPVTGIGVVGVATGGAVAGGPGRGKPSAGAVAGGPAVAGVATILLP